MIMKKVAVLAFDGISPFHLSVPSVVLGEDRTEDGIPRYDVTVCTAEERPIRTNAGFSVFVPNGLASLESAQMVIVPSWRKPGEDEPPEPLIDALVAAHRRGAKIVGLCLGSFVLAAAGLLNGRRATTHWRYTEELARQYPNVHIDPDVLWVDGGDVVTSAGTAAALDCCLHLVRQDYGARVAARIARRLVIPPHRSGSQAQYIEKPLGNIALSNPMEEILTWMQDHLDSPLSIDQLAQRAHYSRRTFTREFRAVMGTSPLQWLLSQRLSRAQELLETTLLTVEDIAQRCGLGTAISLRQHFRRAFNTTPRNYRRELTQIRQPGDAGRRFPN